MNILPTSPVQRLSIDTCCYYQFKILWIYNDSGNKIILRREDVELLLKFIEENKDEPQTT